MEVEKVREQIKVGEDVLFQEQEVEGELDGDKMPTTPFENWDKYRGGHFWD